MIKAVVFDYGGTLVQSTEPWDAVRPRAIRSAHRFLKKRGLRMSGDEYLAVNDDLFRRYAELEAAEGRDIPDRTKYLDLVDRLFPTVSKARRRALATGANNAFWRVANGNFELRASATDCLDELDSMGMKLGLISNHHDGTSLMLSLRRYRITHRFNSIVISEKVDVRKPDPAIFKLCLSAMKVRPRQAVYVGDVPEFDVAGARATGMSSILIGKKGGDGPDPDFAIKDLEEIPPIVASLNRNGLRTGRKPSSSD